MKNSQYWNLQLYMHLIYWNWTSFMNLIEAEQMKFTSNGRLLFLSKLSTDKNTNNIVDMINNKTKTSTN